MKHMKKILSFLLTFAVTASMLVLPSGVFAENESTGSEPTVVGVTDDTYVRCAGGVVYKGNSAYVNSQVVTMTDDNKSSYTTGQLTHNAEATLYTSDATADTTGSRRRTYLKFTLSEEQKTAVQSAQYVVLKLGLKSDESTSASKATLTVHGLKDTNKTFDTATLTYDGTKDVLEKVENPIASVTGISEVCELDVTDYVTEETDGSYAFKLVSDEVLAFYSKEKSGDVVKPSLVFYSEAPAEKTAVETDAAALSPASVVSESFLLSTSGDAGSSIAWTSSDSDTIAISGGTATVTPSQTAHKSVTLTATVTNGSFQTTKSFEVIVLSNSAEWSVAPTADTWVRSNGGNLYTNEIVYSNGTEVTLTDDNKSSYKTGDLLKYSDNKLYAQSKELTKDSGGYRRSYLKFAPSEADAAMLASADRVVLKLTKFAGNGKATEEGAAVTVHGLTGDLKNFDVTKLTYNTSENLESVTNPLATKTEVDKADTMELDVTEYVRAQTDGVYAFKLDGNDKLAEFHSLESATAAARPCLVAYTDDVNTVKMNIDGGVCKLTDPLKAGKANISLKVERTETQNPSGILIAALYDVTDGVASPSLETVAISDASGEIASGSKYTYQLSLNIADATNKIIKVFLWQGWNMVPVLETTTIGVSAS